MVRLYLFLAKKAMFVLVALLMVEPVFALVPNDPEFNKQAITYEQINAPAAWEYSVGVKEIVVATIDTGVDTWHEDLRDNIWINSDEVPNNGKDDDRNGYIDDVNGWNFVENNNEPRPSVFEVEDDKEAVRHGTLVAGLVGASGNNTLDGTGVSWKTTIMPLRSIKSNGNGSFEAVRAAVDYAAENGADIISMSFMSEIPDAQLLNSLRRAYENGVLIISAAGNFDPEKEIELKNKPLYPACFDEEEGSGENWILTVGSVDLNGVVSEFSHNRCVDIYAPGEEIYSSERYAPQYGYPNQFGGPWYGTSFAAPVVAGSSVLIKSLHPEWSPNQIIKILNSAGDIKVKTTYYASTLEAAPLLNVGRAVETALLTPIQNNFGLVPFIRSDSEVWVYDLEKNKNIRIISVAGSVIVHMQAFEDHGEEKIAVLFRKGQKFFIRTYSKTGKLITELALLSRPEKLAVNFNEGVLEFVVSEFRSGKTIFTNYSISGKKLGSRTVTGFVFDWKIKGSKIFLFIVQKNDLRIESIPLGVGNTIKKSLRSVGQVLGTGISNDGAIALTKKGNNLSLMQFNLEDLSCEVKDLGRSTERDWKLQVFEISGKTFYLPLKTSGGNVVVYDKNLMPALTTKILAINGSIK